MSKLKTGISWFEKRNWTPKPFQKKTWQAVLKGENGLLNSPTGSGKTLALFTPILLKEYENLKANQLKAIWITPLKSLAQEIALSTESFAQDNDINITVEVRNGDTSTSDRKKQMKRPPFMLVITPESLHLLLSYKDSFKYFRSLQYIVVDEWHELLSSKRGVQTELAIATLRHINPNIQTWGISATIGNLDQARQVLLNQEDGYIIKNKQKKKTEVVTLLPKDFSRFSWSGHLGIQLIDEVLTCIHQSKSTLVFTNTRAQSEIWFQKLLERDASLAGVIALHHGSLDRSLRLWVEEALRKGQLKVVVCTSSLDLGVDFPSVDTVVQVGGPKGVARFMQRAGRSGHQPDQKSRIFFLPTHALEILEGAALKDAIKAESIEERPPIVLAYDVLVQFVVTLALTGGYSAETVKEIVKSTHAYQLLEDAEWQWVLNFVIRGAQSLEAYDSYQKVVEKEGLLKVDSRMVAMRHRMHIGTIVSDSMMRVKFQSGGYLGTIEEFFISKIKPGETFIFTGRSLELVRIKDMDVHVKISKKKKGVVASYAGGRLPLSARLGEHIRHQLSPELQHKGPELTHLNSLLTTQKLRSHVPDNDELLLEFVQTREGYHLFCYPFEGRFVHEAMASLLAYRIGLVKPITFSVASSDYGFELVSSIPWNPDIITDNNLFTPEHLFDDINASLNTSEIASRKFRDIANIAGLVFQGYPGAYKKTKQLQASSQLLFKVFRDYEPDNLLYRQSFTETFEEAIEENRLRNALKAIQSKTIVLQLCEHPSPFSFPILADRWRSKMSSEKFENRVERLIKQIDK